jgi:pSer/pThr/pTyr-binding forkhead associated (FHA) protein
MPKPIVTFQVLEGIDKGRIFRDLPTPLTVGREEGNILRLNDERVSRFHAKVQLDEDDYILTDLESTNGTKVNGSIVNIRRLRFGDRVAVGRSILMFGSNDEIAERMARLESNPHPIPNSSLPSVHGDDLKTVQAKTQIGVPDSSIDFEVRLDEPIRQTPDAIYIGSKVLPPLPLKMTASQAARLAEIFDFLHHGLIDATERIQANDDGTSVTLDFHDWQRIQGVQMLISRYLRLISEPQEPAAENEK